MKENNGNQFRSDEIVMMRRLNKRTGEYVESEFPKVGGRLRLAHSQNDTLDIQTEVFKYDGSLAIVKATCTTNKGIYSGIGMASLERDQKIAPAILELAETRAVARALRFAGYGVEYCGAEEISHVDEEHTENSQVSPQKQQLQHQQKSTVTIPKAGSRRKQQPIHAQGSNSQNRISQKQLSFLSHLADERGISRKELDNMSKERYGCLISFISKNDASSFINEMTAN